MDRLYFLPDFLPPLAEHPPIKVITTNMGVPSGRSWSRCQFTAHVYFSVHISFVPSAIV